MYHLPEELIHPSSSRNTKFSKSPYSHFLSDNIAFPSLPTKTPAPAQNTSTIAHFYSKAISSPPSPTQNNKPIQPLSNLESSLTIKSNTTPPPKEQNSHPQTIMLSLPTQCSLQISANTTTPRPQTNDTNMSLKILQTLSRGINKKL